jgi:DNA-binding transcriptional LysR family regulator
MEMQQVRYFLALAEQLNITRAAEACNVTQPALTRAIKGLEGEFGGTLFHRERNNSHLTELGRTILPYVTAIHDQSAAAKEKSRAFRQLDDVSLKLGVMCTIGPYVLSDLVRKFHAEFSGVSLSISEDSDHDAAEQLMKGELEIAIVNKTNAEDERLHCIPLYPERFVIVIPDDHPLASRDVVPVQALKGVPYVSRANCEVFYPVVAEFQNQGVDLEVAFRSPREDWILGMIRAGLGFGFFPEFQLLPDDLVRRPIVEPAFDRQISIVTMRGRPHSPAVGALIKLAKSLTWPTSSYAPDDWVVRV